VAGLDEQLTTRTAAKSAETSLRKTMIVTPRSERCGPWGLTGYSYDRMPGQEVPGTASRALAASGRVLLAELVHAAGGVDDLLLARIEGMAARAHLDLEVMAQRGARLEGVAAAADDGDLFVLGMDGVFHGAAVLGGAERRLKGARV
jgi:hypothetical protein